uniref:Eppin n=1 Tax=Prolemur simus TaxID=1328070 RepID=A0A8C8YCK4_PROSS
MKLSGLLSFLVLCILVLSVQGPGLTEWLFPKRCPRIREQCEFKERDLCTKDRQCQDNKKCCVFNCGKKFLKSRVSWQIYALCPKKLAHNNTCSIFIYGGCQGNNNNFQTKAICLNTCQKKREFRDPSLTRATLGGLGVGRSVPG